MKRRFLPSQMSSIYDPFDNESSKKYFTSGQYKDNLTNSGKTRIVRTLILFWDQEFSALVLDDAARPEQKQNP